MTIASTHSDPHPTIIDDAVFNEGDMILVSSDNVRFRLPSFYLLAASPVIRRTYKAAGGSPSIPCQFLLTDHELEHSDAIRAWLQVATDALPAKYDPGLLAHWVVPLARRFECSHLVLAVTSLLYRALDSATNSEKGSIVYHAMGLGLSEVVAKAIASDGPEYHFRCSEADALSYAPVGSYLDPSTWSMKDFTRMPSGQLWAVMQARAMGGMPCEQADRYLYLVNEMYRQGPTVASVRQMRLRECSSRSDPKVSHSCFALLPSSA